MIKPKNIGKVVADKILARAIERLHRVENKLNYLTELLKSSSESLANDNRSFHDDLKNSISNIGFVRLSENEILTKIFTGAKFYLDPRDIGLVPHLLLDKEWERDITHAWLKTVQPGDTVFDIGANFGYFGVLAAQQSNRNCKVVMFEANPNLISYLNKTVTVNAFLDQIKVENLAVSDKPGNVTLNILKDYIASSSVHDIDKLNSYNQNGAELSIAERVSVPAISIDEYCKNNGITAVNLIKMDIEGHEQVAYKGMKDTIKKSPAITMFIEFTKGGYDRPEAFYSQMLKDFGNVYTIDSSGNLLKPSETGYDSIVGTAKDWVMLVFSKQDNLA
jgi:FkbM family methyltransferase